MNYSAIHVENSFRAQALVQISPRSLEYSSARASNSSP